MPFYQEVTRTESSSVLPKKQVRHISRQWFTVIRIVGSMICSALLFVLVHDLTGSGYAFFLLPVLLSFFMSASRDFQPSKNPLKLRYGFDPFANNTPIYLLFTFFLSFLYYLIIAFFVLLWHQDSVPIIYVAVTLSSAVLLEPIHEYLQSRIESSFNVRNRETRKAVAAFTAALREEIDLDQLRERFLALIQQIIRPYSVSFWTLAHASQQEPSEVQRYTKISVESDDPLIIYALEHPGLVEIERLPLVSPVVRNLRANMVEIVLLLVSQGELIGLLALGPRVDGREYSSEDCALLDSLAGQVAPALRVAWVVREQQEQVRERERIEQELRTARAIQLTFLPGELPDLPAWQISPYYCPAREVGGDFYDFFLFENGWLGLVIGDVAGKGVPAALVMATVHTLLRSTVRQQLAPGEALERVNDLLVVDMPAGMFVTCCYAMFDPATGHMRYANAGHELPLLHRDGSVAELWATGMPLGLMAGTSYEEYEETLAQGETLLFYSDGLVEAHSPEGEMFGFEHLQTLLASHVDPALLIDFLLENLRHFTGEEWEQEDDVTLVLLQRTGVPTLSTTHGAQEALQLLQETTISSVSGGEQAAMEWVAEVVRPWQLAPTQLEDLETAVSEIVMNAIEHGHGYVSEQEVLLQVLASSDSLIVRVRDQGDGQQYPILEPGVPDLEEKLAEHDRARGWGLFLAKKLVDDLHIINDKHFHVVELIVRHSQTASSTSQA